MASVSMTVNGQAVTREVEPRTLLVEFLRQHLHLTGTHVGCDTSQCGACVVHIDGQSVKSCTVLALQAEGRQITTIEGLAKNGELHPMQAAFREHHGLQCGFCTPGMIMSAIDLVQRNPTASEHEIREWLEGNLCRCTGYHNIVKAIQAAAQRDEELAMASDGIGASIRRKEDYRFITGGGSYTDDIDRPGQVYAYFVRSPHAHARINGIDKSAAEAAPGVLAVLTGDDVKAAGWGGLICGWMVKSRDGADMKAGPHPILAQGKARYVGDHVACVVADELPPGQGCRRAGRGRLRGPAGLRVRPRTPATAGQPQVHDEIARNTVYEWELGDPGGGRPGDRQRRPRHHGRARQQPPGAERDRAARRDRRVRSRHRRASRSTPRARTRTSRAW